MLFWGSDERQEHQAFIRILVIVYIDICYSIINMCTYIYIYVYEGSTGPRNIGYCNLVLKPNTRPLGTPSFWIHHQVVPIDRGATSSKKPKDPIRL